MPIGQSETKFPILIWRCSLTFIPQAVSASQATNPLAGIMMSDIEEATPENSLIDLSDSDIEIGIEQVLVSYFPENQFFFSFFFTETLLCYIFVFCYYHLLFCSKINILQFLKMVRIK